MRNNINTKVIILGASSGIGEELAYIYANKGCMVCIGARREEKLKIVASKFPNNILYVCLDVSYANKGIENDIYGAMDGLQKMIDKLSGADIIIYCSGAGEQKTILNIEKEINTCKVNIDGFTIAATVAINYFISNRLRSSITPTFAVISSVASLRGLGVSASYSASKHFQTTYMEGLSQFIFNNKYNINLCCILPGFVATDFIGKKDYPLIMSVEYVAKRIVHSINKGKFFAIIDWRWQIVCFIWRLIPGFIWRRVKL